MFFRSEEWFTAASDADGERRDEHQSWTTQGRLCQTKSPDRKGIVVVLLVNPRVSQVVLKSFWDETDTLVLRNTDIPVSNVWRHLSWISWALWIPLLRQLHSMVQQVLINSLLFYLREIGNPHHLSLLVIVKLQKLLWFYFRLILKSRSSIRTKWS